MTSSSRDRPPGWLAGFIGSARRQGRWLLDHPWDRALLTWLPLLAGALIVWVFASGFPRNLPIVLVDEDQSARSRELARYLDASPGIRIADQTTQWAEAQRRLLEREAFGIVLIPRYFERDLLDGTGTSVQWHYNAQFQTHVGGLTRDVRAVVATYSAGAAIRGRMARGQWPLQAREAAQPVRLQLVSVYNESASYLPFLAMSLVPALLQVFMTLAAVNGLGRELKNGTVPQWLAAAGGHWSAAILGVLAWPALAFMAQGAIFVIVFNALGWTITGSVAAVLLGLGGLIAAQLALGLFFVGATLSLRNAISGAGLVTAPAFAFSGQGYPLVAMPPLARLWAELLPLTHYLQLQSRCWLGGAPLRYGLGEVLVLYGYALGAGLVGYWLLSRRALSPAVWGRI